ncbi:MAG: hypothetical protein MMC33_007608 [Icmadophila ericetorum]|nr:hypothetical protein [Icmadophila ericetorum]
MALPGLKEPWRFSVCLAVPSFTEGYLKWTDPNEFEHVMNEGKKLKKGEHGKKVKDKKETKVEEQGGRKDGQSAMD